MTLSKRLFDVIFGVVLLVLLLPVMALVAVLCLLFEGRPVFYLSERMYSRHKGFKLIKFRSMRPSPENSGVTCGDRTNRVSEFQNILRKSRLDELPQLLNILLGHMSFVGPRPPLRIYVEDFPELYTQVLKSRPGVTGLATIKIHRYEEELLARCDTGEETDRVYRSLCIPKKAEFDLIYQRHRSFCFDCKILWATAIRSVGGV